MKDSPLANPVSTCIQQGDQIPHNSLTMVYMLDRAKNTIIYIMIPKASAICRTNTEMLFRGLNNPRSRIKEVKSWNFFYAATEACLFK